MPEFVLTPEASKGARSERIHLNPSEVAGADRIEIDLHAGPIQVREQGIDWGDDAIEAFMAQGQYGQKPVDYRLPNRIITIPLILGAIGDFDEARIALQAEAARINEEGGTLKREIIGGTYGEAGDHLFCDLVKATLKLSDDTHVASEGLDPNAELILEALPDFYGDLITEAIFKGAAGVGHAAKTFQIKGNLPGRADITVAEEGAVNQHAFLWHFRCRNYLASAEAAWALAVESFELIGVAAKVTLAGSIGTKVVQHANLTAQWTGIAARNLQHRGVYDVWVRAFTTSTSLPYVRLVYDVGDLIAPTENTGVQIPGANAYYLLHLGQVNLEEAPVGSYRWRPLLQAYGLEGGENISFDEIWFLNAAESSGTPSAPKQLTVGLAPALVYDAFNQTAGAATGKTPSPGPGAAYTVLTNSDTTDYQITGTSSNPLHTLTRLTASDTGTINTTWLKGRGIGAGTVQYTSFGIANDFSNLPLASGFQHGYIFRWVNTTNFAAAWLEQNASGFGWELRVAKVVEGAFTFIGGKLLNNQSPILSGRLEMLANEGEVTVYLSGTEIGTFFDTDLAAGGALAKGRSYLYDANTSATGWLRIYDNLEIFPLSFDAVNFASKIAHLRFDGLFRISTEGFTGDIPRQVSDLARVPVSGPEARPVELAVKTSRGDLAAQADSGRDALGVTLAYRPCWSDVPSL